jgi:uncharacterized protein YutE (UPF0331/DUF86 family)
VVLRPDAVRARLARLETVVTRLEELARAAGVPGRGDALRDWAIERGLQLGAEIVFDVGNHVLSAHFGVAARDYEDITTQLAALGVIPVDLRERLKGPGGFRNILVHGYLDLDRERVIDALGRAPGEFSEFSHAVRAWLTTVAE